MVSGLVYRTECLKKYISFLNLSWIKMSIFEAYGAHKEKKFTASDSYKYLTAHRDSVSLIWKRISKCYEIDLIRQTPDSLVLNTKPLIFQGFNSH